MERINKNTYKLTYFQWLLIIDILELILHKNNQSPHLFISQETNKKNVHFLHFLPDIKNTAKATAHANIKKPTIINLVEIEIPSADIDVGSGAAVVES